MSPIIRFSIAFAVTCALAFIVFCAHNPAVFGPNLDSALFSDARFLQTVERIEYKSDVSWSGQSLSKVVFNSHKRPGYTVFSESAQTLIDRHLPIGFVDDYSRAPLFFCWVALLAFVFVAGLKVTDSLSSAYSSHDQKAA